VVANARIQTETQSNSQRLKQPLVTHMP